MAEQVEVLVDGGKASAGPPLGPALGPLGVNVVQVVKTINEKTKAFEGMKVPVKIVVDAQKNFTVTVGTPPTSALILKEIGAEKGSGTPKTAKIGDLTIEQVKKIAQMKKEGMLGHDLKARVREVVGTCVSMGVTVDGKDPKEVQKLINEGVYNDSLKE